MYAWPDYFPPPLIAKFQAETGIHINYAVFDDPAMAETTLSVGSSGYDMVLKKEIAARFANCGISVLDSWGDVLPMVARYLGQTQLAADRASLDAVMAKLAEIKPYIRLIASSGYYEQLADGELCLSIGYSGDAIIARRMAQDGHTSVHLAYSFARESVPFWIDNLVIPADSPNPDGALAVINFVMRPEMSAEVTRFIGFATGNAAAMPLLEPAVRDNVIIYPPASVRERFALEKVYTPDEMRTFVRAWQRFKAAQ